MHWRNSPISAIYPNAQIRLLIGLDLAKAYHIKDQRTTARNALFCTTFEPWIGRGQGRLFTKIPKSKQYNI